MEQDRHYLSRNAVMSLMAARRLVKLRRPPWTGEGDKPLKLSRQVYFIFDLSIKILRKI